MAVQKSGFLKQMTFRSSTALQLPRDRGVVAELKEVIQKRHESIHVQVDDLTCISFVRWNFVEVLF